MLSQIENDLNTILSPSMINTVNSVLNYHAKINGDKEKLYSVFRKEGWIGVCKLLTELKVKKSGIDGLDIFIIFDDNMKFSTKHMPNIQQFNDTIQFLRSDIEFKGYSVDKNTIKRLRYASKKKGWV